MCYSENGINWTSVTLPNNSFSSYGCAYGKGKYVMLGYSNNIGFVSENGLEWKQITLPESSTWYDITYGLGIFVAFSMGSNKILWSSDAETWHVVTIPNVSLRSVTYGNNKFIAMAEDRIILLSQKR